MARTTFEGVVRGYSVGDDGRVWLSVDETKPSDSVAMRVRDMVRDFNPSSGRGGFGSKDVPCPVKPGFASFRVALSQDEVNAKGITHGSYVDLTIDVGFVRRVVFVSGRNGKPGRWAAMPEMYHEVVGVEPVTHAPSVPANPNKPPKQSGATPTGEK